MSAAAIQDLYPGDYAHCFGCGRLNEHGHRIKTHWIDGEGVARFTPQAHEVSLPGYVYGGLIASLVDCHAIATAAADAAERAGTPFVADALPRYVTGSLKVDFKKPTPIGVELELRARVREASERKALVEVTVRAGDVVTATGEVVAVRMPETMRRS
ncbi:MAG TPA: PaaI family thioesterase [Thermoanaerobaculia bacterium]|nr:PaaI family thioesterase [Thermoanaerobaculia bacterium]